MAPALLSVGFQSLSMLPTIKLGPSGADSRVAGFVYVLGPCGSLQWSLLWGWEFLLLLPQPPPSIFNQRFEALFPCPGALGLHSLFHSPFVPPGLSALECGTARSTSHQPRICQLLLAGQLQPGPPCSIIWHLAGLPSHHLAASPLCPGRPSLPLLPVWMNISSLTLWLSDSHIVCFSGSSGYFLFLNLSLSFFWLCEEAQVCLPTPPSWLEVNVIPILLDFVYLFIWDGSLGTAYIWVLFSYPLSYPMSFGCSI